jgi:sulfite reductase beta subunit-like hemoprotein
MRENMLVDDVPDDDLIPIDQNLDALTYLQMVYRGIQAEGPRMRAAMACLPFETPKLSVVASINDPSAFAERLERAIQRSGIRPLMLEHAPQPKPAPQPSSVTGPMVGTDRKMRRL